MSVCMRVRVYAHLYVCVYIPIRKIMYVQLYAHTFTDVLHVFQHVSPKPIGASTLRAAAPARRPAATSPRGPREGAEGWRSSGS